VLKIVRHALAGVHPEGEMTRFLTEKGFGNIAPLFGEVVRVDADGTPNALMLAQGFVRNQGDGWTWTLDFLARALEELAVTGGGQSDQAHADAFATYENFAAAMGRRLGELHAVLAMPNDQPEFRPETADDAMLGEWAESAIEQIDLAFGLLRGIRDWPDEETKSLAQGLLEREGALHDAAHRLARHGHGALRTRVHGDFHLGQVLVVQGDAYIIDFEGEPARPMEQRRAKSCPLRDAAGLMRSFDYAAATGIAGRVAGSQQTGERRAVLVERFRAEASRHFLDAYRSVLHQTENKWVPEDAEAPLLDLFLLEKAAYEVRYEASNRPTWLRIPLRGLTEIADRILIAEPVA
jgi:maltose alpha-D-glucosyltransferase/alpha-amylase